MDGANDDCELDHSKTGIGDEDGLTEQTYGEPNLGATIDLDQELAWSDEGRSSWIVDGETTGTEDDLKLFKPYEASLADRQVARRLKSCLAMLKNEPPKDRLYPLVSSGHIDKDHIEPWYTLRGKFLHPKAYKIKELTEIELQILITNILNTNVLPI